MQATNIMVPIDFSEQSRHALEHAASLARESGATLLVVHVKEPPHYFPPTGSGIYADPNHTKEGKRLADFVPRGLGVHCEYQIRIGDPADEIVKVVEDEDVDLIVMGTHGRSGISRMLMGSVAEAVVRQAPCPVLTYKQPRQMPDRVGG